MCGTASHNPMTVACREQADSKTIIISGNKRGERKKIMNLGMGCVAYDFRASWPNATEKYLMPDKMAGKEIAERCPKKTGEIPIGPTKHSVPERMRSGNQPIPTR